MRFALYDAENIPAANEKTKREMKQYMANWNIQTERCKGCGLCADACPRKILRIDPGVINHKGHFSAQITDESRCTGCGFCVLMCPDCAITLTRQEG